MQKNLLLHIAQCVMPWIGLFNKWIIYIWQQSHHILAPKLKALQNNSLPNLQQEICGSLQWEMELQVSDHIYMIYMYTSYWLSAKSLLYMWVAGQVFFPFALWPKCKVQGPWIEWGKTIDRKFLKIWEDEGGRMVCSPHVPSLNLPSHLIKRKAWSYVIIHLNNQVQDPHCKLRTKLFPLQFMTINRREKNKDL